MAQPLATKVGGNPGCMAGMNIVIAGMPFIKTLGHPKQTISGAGNATIASGGGCGIFIEPIIKAGMPFWKMFGWKGNKNGKAQWNETDMPTDAAGNMIMPLNRLSLRKL